MIVRLLEGFNASVLVYFVLLNAIYLTTSLIAVRALRRYAFRLKALQIEDLIMSAGALPVTLIVPAYNEEATCVEAARAILTLQYPDYEVLIVNDGSQDATLARLTQAFDLAPAARYPITELPTRAIRGVYRSRRSPALWVIDKENGGKSDALNAGINYCMSPLLVAMDADSLLERDALMRLVRPFLEEATTVAAGGTVRIANGCGTSSGVVEDVRLPIALLARYQVLEYLRSFLSGRVGWDALGATLIISGTLGLFRRSTVIDVGGFATDTVGEDMELVMRLHHHCRKNCIPYRISFIPDPIAWTECPENFRTLRIQRDRWQRGLIQSLWRHRGMFLNPRYGAIGLLAFSYFVLETISPLVELAGYVGIGVALAVGTATLPGVLAFLSVAIVLGSTLSIASVGLEELSFRRYRRFSDLLRLFVLAFLESFGYHQLQTWWRVRAFFSLFQRGKGWGRMERKGFAAGASR